MARISSIKQLREGLGEAASPYSDEELLMALSSATGLDPTQAAVRFGYDTAGGPWSEKASASIDNYQAGLYGLGEAVLGGTGLEETFARRRRANEISAGISGDRAQRGGIPANWDEVDGVGSAARYVGGLALDSAPYLAEAAVGGVAGRLLVGGAEALTATQAAARARNASLAGAVGASYPSSVGDVLQSQRDQAGTTDLGSAAALGVPYAALNAFGLEGLAARATLPRIATSALDNIQGVRGGLARAGATGLRTSASEGVSESGQEVVNQLGRMAVDPNAGLSDEDALKRYLDSFIGGAALGGPVGAGAGGWRRSSSPMAPLPTPEPEAPSGDPIDVLQLGFNPLAGTPRVFPDGTVTLGSEAEFNYRNDPRASDMMPSEPMGPQPLPPGTIGFEEVDVLSMADGPRPGLQMPGVDFDQYEGAGTGMSASQGRVPPAPYRPDQNFDTTGLSYEGQDQLQPMGLSPTELPLSLAPVGQPMEGRGQGVPPVEFAYDTGSLALAPQGSPAAQAPVGAVSDGAGPAGTSLPSPIPGGPSTPEAAAALAKTQKLSNDAKDMVARAEQAGMASEKQQTTFWRAEKMQADGAIDEGQMTQVIALLMQSKYGRANKMLDEAVAPSAPTAPASPAAPSTQTARAPAATEEVEIVGGSKSTPAAVAAPEAKTTPDTIASTPSAPPATLAQRVKQSAARAGKLKRYEALLSCLQRGKPGA
jgi:hypothetical protein